MGRYMRPAVLFMVVAALLVAGSVAGLAAAAGDHHIVVNLLHASLPWLALIFAAQTLAYWAYTIPYRDIFRLGARPAIEHAFEGFQPYRPGGGFLYDMHMHRPTGGQRRVLYLSIWEYAALAPAVLAAAVTAYLAGTVHPALTLPWIIGVPAGAALFGLGVWQYEQLKRFPRLCRLVDGPLGMLRDQPAHCKVRILLGMLLYWTGEVVAVWAALRLFNARLGWTPLIVAYATGYAISRRSLPLGGAGIVLVALSFALCCVGMPLASAVLAALAYQFSNLLIPVLIRPLLRRAEPSVA